MAAEAMTRTTEATHDVAVFTLEGEVGQLLAADLSEALFRLVNRRTLKVVLDLSRVVHLDYRALKPLMARVRVLRCGGGDIKLAGLSSYLLAILRVAGAHDVFECHATLAQACGAFGWDGASSPADRASAVVASGVA